MAANTKQTIMAVLLGAAALLNLFWKIYNDSFSGLSVLFFAEIVYLIIFCFRLQKLMFIKIPLLIDIVDGILGAVDAVNFLDGGVFWRVMLGRAILCIICAVVMLADTFFSGEGKPKAARIASIVYGVAVILACLMATITWWQYNLIPSICSSIVAAAYIVLFTMVEKTTVDEKAVTRQAKPANGALLEMQLKQLEKQFQEQWPPISREEYLMRRAEILEKL